MEKKRFKMYKRKKTWVVAPIIFLGLLGASAFAMEDHAVFADEVGKEQVVQVLEPEAEIEAAPSADPQSEIVEEGVAAIPPAIESNTPVDTTAEEKVPETEITERPATSIEETEEEAEIPPVEKGESLETSEGEEDTQFEEAVPDPSELTEAPNKDIVEEVETKEPNANNEKVVTTTVTPKAATTAKAVPKVAAPKAQAKAAPAPTIAIYRVYNPNSGEHLHTMNSYEKDHLVKVGWRYEGISMRVPLTGRQLFRVYNPNSGEHFYTLDGKERDHLKRVG